MNDKESYKILYKGGEAEVIEKKSRFIATLRPVDSEEEALAFIEAMKKKYWDASHNCSAYVIGQRHELKRSGDDGEPQGTAGHPMLHVLLGEEIHNAAVVVTRYFGGTLLGTGGLVRAYSRAVQDGLKNSVIVEKCPGIRLGIRTDYSGIGKIQYIAGQRGIHITNSVYADKVELELLCPLSQVEDIKRELMEAFNGQVIMEPLQEVYFGIQGKEVLFFD